jgi:hypothetical protein
MKKKITLIALFVVTIGKAQSHQLNCEHIHKIDNPKEYYDEYSSGGGYENLTVMKKNFKSAFFNSKDSDLKSIVIRIQTQSDGANIMSDSKLYEPKENEIALFLEDEDRKSFIGTSQKMFFKVGGKLKTSIVKGKTNGLKILEFIKCGMLNLKRMPIDDKIVESLENEIMK